METFTQEEEEKHKTTNKETDKRASRLLTTKHTMIPMMFLHVSAVLKACSSYR